MDYGMLNLASVVLGVIALAVSFRAFDSRKWPALFCVSVASCMAAVCCQFMYHVHLISIGDWAALADLKGLALMASVFLIALTAIENFIMVRAYMYQTEQH